jgi:integrase
MRGKITKRAVDALTVGASLTDTEVKGFIARRLPSGAVTYGFRYRSGGKQRWAALGLHGSITPDQARALAKKRAGEVADNRDPVAERKATRAEEENTVDAVLDEFIERYVKKQELRSAETIENTFKRLVRPRIGTKPIYHLKRKDIVDLLDAVEDASGPVMADRTLAYVRKAFNWQAARDDNFVSPIVKGMARTKPAERKRTRILDDQEIRDVWAALDCLTLGEDAPECYPGFIRMLLLSGQRRENVARAHRDEIKSPGWIIPDQRVRDGIKKGGMKSKLDHLVPITSAMQRLVGNRAGFLFSSDDGGTPFSGFSKAKRALDRKITELRKQDGRKQMPHWTLHDLRRTARSIMSRYSTPDIAERVIGHVIPGVRGVYDLYQYRDEKLAALEKLAAHIERILHPRETVVRFPKRARGRKRAA